MEDNQSSDPPAENEFFNNVFSDLMANWIIPEVERRIAAGNFEPPLTLSRMQMLMKPDGSTRVRLNEEVQAVVRAVATRPIKAGEHVTADDIDDVEDVELLDSDPDEAHITVVSHNGSWILVFDFRYNAVAVASHVTAAREFIEAASQSLSRGNLRAFADTLHSAAELLAKARLLQDPSTKLLTSRKHGAIHHELNAAAKTWSDISPHFPKTFKHLANLRASARYLNSDFNLTQDRAREMLSTVSEAGDIIDQNRPRRHSPLPTSEDQQSNE